MKSFDIDGVEFNTDIDKLNYNDATKIVERLNQKEAFPVVKVTVRKMANGKLDCDYWTRPPKFERIRRITGYLVGTMDRWNDAKRHEEAERVKHIE